MNLLAYTKRLSEQIAYFDMLAKNSDILKNLHITNPFTQPINITIVWIEEKDED